MRISKICRNFILAALMISYCQCYSDFPAATPVDQEKITATNEIITALTSAASAAQNAPLASSDPVGEAALAKLVAARSETIGLIESCKFRIQAATGLCLESTAPSFGKFLTEYGAMVQMISSMGANMAGQCSTIGDMLKTANVAITAFQAGCIGAQAFCESACGAIAKSVISYHTAATAAQSANVAGAASQTGFADNIKIQTSKATSLCGSYKANIAFAGMGILSSLAGMQTANNCKNSNEDVGTLDCTNQKSTIYNSTNCKCARNELPAAECQGINLATLAVPGKNGIAAGAGGASGGALSEGIDLDDGNVEREVNANVETAAAGAPLEGGGSGASGGGGSGGAQDGSRSAASSRLNPNILGGFGSGGGGGGSGAGPGYGEIDPQMKAYMPGQEKDPARSMASEFKKQVSHPDGRSNWEKINRRYLDNYRNLLKN